ncbi:MAG TPA: ROK family protein [Terriglobia bacterium]|nr:ROK family protein [Terriglobia bacterium]
MKSGKHTLARATGAGGLRSRAGTDSGSGWVAGIDMGASNLRFARADLRGHLGAVRAEQVRPEGGPAGVIAQIKAGIEGLGPSGAVHLGHASRKRSGLAAIAIGVPSAVDPRTGRVSLANNLPGWRDIDLRWALESAFNVPVVVDNDANLAALGELWKGTASGAANFVFVALGTGIGAGIVVDRRLCHGRTGNAGELYRLNVDWRQWAQVFRDTGYFEAHVAGLGIAAAGRRALGTRRRSGARRLVETRDAHFVFEAFRKGDSRARAVLERAFTMLGVGVANLVCVLDPDLIVLGGGLTRGAPDFMLETVERVLKRIHPDIAPPVRLSSLGDRAQIYGAVFAALAAVGRAPTERAVAGDSRARRPAATPALTRTQASPVN